MSEFQDNTESGDGAQFWAYVSPENDTLKHITRWEVRIEHTDDTWSGVISSDNPEEILRTPNLSGIFKVTVRASGREFEVKTLPPKPGSNPDIGCKSNCTAIVGIVATEGGEGANYWTTWDAICC